MAKIFLKNGRTADVEIDSQFIARDEVRIETLDALRNACVNAALEKAVDIFGEKQALTVRDLNGTDMSYTNNIFTETSNASANAWNAMAQGAFTVARGTVLGIYGLKVYTVLDATIKQCPITGIRFDVGGGRVAQWHIQTIDTCANAAVSASTRAYMGVTKSPIIMQEDITVTPYEYTRTASTVYTPIWLGVAVEKVGLTLRP